MPSIIEIQPIGFFEGPQTRPYLLPRQPGPLGVDGVVKVEPAYAEGLRDLEGFGRIWLLFAFDRAQEEKLLVQPPGQLGKRGVFATRSPHRPNRIGMSAVKLMCVDGRAVYVTDCDLLDGTAILDIKPYVTVADCHPGSQQGWLQDRRSYTVSFACDEALDWLLAQGGPDLRRAAQNVLGLMPQPSHHNRISHCDGLSIWACQTWRLHFTLDEASSAVLVLAVHSGYSEQELSGEDRWGDQALHKRFLRR